MVAKTKLHFMTGLNAGAAALTNGTIATDKRSYLTLLLLPWGGNFLTSTTPDAGMTANNVNAIGIGRLLGTVGTASLYTNACCLRVQGWLSLTISEAGATDSDYKAAGGKPRANLGQVVYRVRDNSEGGLTAPLTQATADIQYVQPNCRKKRWMDVSSNTVYNQAVATALVRPAFPSVRTTFTVDHFIHTVVDESFAAYVSNSSSFAGSAAAPQNYALIDIATFWNSANGTYTCPNAGYIQGELVFTCIFKDPIASIAN
jgi:hypothetical protein